MLSVQSSSSNFVFVKRAYSLYSVKLLLPSSSSCRMMSFRFMRQSSCSPLLNCLCGLKRMAFLFMCSSPTPLFDHLCQKDFGLYILFMEVLLRFTERCIFCLHILAVSPTMYD